MIKYLTGYCKNCHKQTKQIKIECEDNLATRIFETVFTLGLLAMEEREEQVRQEIEECRIRNNLIKILKQGPCDILRSAHPTCEGCPYVHLNNEKTSCFEARYADWLIANGVTLPSCKIEEEEAIHNLNNTVQHREEIK